MSEPPEPQEGQAQGVALVGRAHFEIRPEPEGQGADQVFLGGSPCSRDPVLQLSWRNGKKGQAVAIGEIGHRPDDRPQDMADSRRISPGKMVFEAEGRDGMVPDLGFQGVADRPDAIRQGLPPERS